MTAQLILSLACAYLLGSVSSAILVSKVFGLTDPRQAGSGNPGATNVLRLGGKFPALLVLVFDILKGTVPVWACYLIGFEPLPLGLVALAACLGHIFPLFFAFKGGKAVATAFGTMLPIGLDLSLLLIGTWVAVVLISGYSSLAALTSVALAPLFTWFIKPAYTLPVAMLSILIIMRHKDNILRLWRKQESKIWDKGKSKE